MTPEQKAREAIDKRLEQAGWLVQDMKHHQHNLSIESITDLMYRLALHTGRCLEEPWRTLYSALDYYEEAEEGYLDKMGFVMKLEDFINHKAPFTYYSPTGDRQHVWKKLLEKGKWIWLPQRKKSKVRTYLQGLPHKMPFDELLSDYLDKRLEKSWHSLALQKLKSILTGTRTTSVLAYRGSIKTAFSITFQICRSIIWISKSTRRNTASPPTRMNWTMTTGKH